MNDLKLERIWRALTDPSRKQTVSHGTATGKQNIFHSLKRTPLQSK